MSIKISFPREWIIEVEITLGHLRGRPVTHPILIQGSELCIDVTDLILTPEKTKAFADRITNAVNELAIKKVLELGPL